MKCPKCSGALTAGRLRLRDEWWRIAFYGVSWMIVRFVASAGSFEFLRPGRHRISFACPKCRWVVVPPQVHP